MENKKIAQIFYLISEHLEMEGVPFKPQAYQKAALVLEDMERDVKDIYEESGIEGLRKIPGVGESIASKIKEYLETGKIKYYEKLKKKAPLDLEALTAVEGLGPKRIKDLYEKLDIRNIEDLEEAAKKRKIAPLFGFGEKTEKNILQAISFLKKSKGRFLLGDILPTAQEIKEKLAGLKEVKKIDIVGSLRRKKETIGDLDFLIISSQPDKVMDFFVSLSGVVKVWGKGETKSSVRMEQGFDVDVRVIPPESYGAALQYFTGSKQHNIATRRIAISKGLKLNEYGLFKDEKRIAGETEEKIYKALGMEWIPPEMRRDEGEIEAALEGKLPKLLKTEDVKGDLHCHSSWNGGENSIKELAEKAQELGYQYLGIADHTKFLRIENGLDEEQLSKQREEIEKMNSSFKQKGSSFRVLQGAETNILNDGSIDIENEALSKLDYVIAGIHSKMKMTEKEMTERIIRAMKNPQVDIISHPTGRLLKKREEYKVDFAKILRAAKEFNVYLEINSYPQRLDLYAPYIKRCKQEGVKMVINTDAHQTSQMRYMELGVAQARRGWAEKDDIINTLPISKLTKALSK
ncbi:MAG: DNA polymerase/3'-5' exonuclease PolX [Candidatus Nealsonbacteria bacterium]|nr:DNA polymerase/3'-5' exonuclease PolX [Candidatus Nealsonbacteria bacterium]